MPARKSLSTKEIIARVFRDINPNNSSWVYDCIEWINDALGELGGGYHTHTTNQTITVSNHRIALPCNYEFIKDIEYEGRLLPKKSTLNIQDFDNVSQPYWNGYTSKYALTSFETGEVKVWYNVLTTEKDEDSGIEYPIIPDDGRWMKLYLVEYILMKYLLRGGKHSVRNFQEVRAGIYTQYGDGAGLLIRVQTSIKMLSVADMELVKNSIIGLKTDWNKRAYEWFNTGGKEEIDLTNGSSDAEVDVNLFVNTNYNTPTS